MTVINRSQQATMSNQFVLSAFHAKSLATTWGRHWIVANVDTYFIIILTLTYYNVVILYSHIQTQAPIYKDIFIFCYVINKKKGRKCCYNR